MDEICSGLIQNAAKVRFLRRLGVVVARRPDGSPLVSRAHYEAARGPGKAPANGPTWKVRV